MASKRIDRITFTDISLVPASKCSGCRTPMNPASSTEWACGRDGCAEKGKSVHTGVYPVQPRPVGPNPSYPKAPYSMGCTAGTAADAKRRPQ